MEKAHSVKVRISSLEGMPSPQHQIENALNIDRSGIAVCAADRKRYEQDWEERAKGVTVMVDDLDASLFPTQLVELVQLCHTRRLGLWISADSRVFLREALANVLRLSSQATDMLMAKLFRNGRFVHNVD